ncbi:MAG TPA: hypothetical protein ENG16_00685 [Archaeoglobus sp.]|nr:hypothetical protein [Archaeoglobus sp.]
MYQSEQYYFKKREKLDWNEVDILKANKIGGIVIVDAERFYWGESAHLVWAKDITNFVVLCAAFNATKAIRIVTDHYKHSEVTLFAPGMLNTIIRFTGSVDKK